MSKSFTLLDAIVSGDEARMTQALTEAVREKVTIALEVKKAETASKIFSEGTATKEYTDAKAVAISATAKHQKLLSKKKADPKSVTDDEIDAAHSEVKKAEERYSKHRPKSSLIESSDSLDEDIIKYAELSQ